MKITAYRTIAFQNISTYRADYILSQESPDLMSEEDKTNARNGVMPMCCFKDTESNTWHFIPWEFVIRIEDEKPF